MTSYTMDSGLLSPLFGDGRITEIFSDEAFVRNMLEVESALARVEGRLGVIPQDAARQIAAAAAELEVDLGRLREGIEQSGVPVIDLVRQLREELDGEAAGFVHWGATSQDIIDTAHVLQMRQALELVEGSLSDVIRGLARLADGHRRTLMAGRTHSQQALPIPFGLKAAGWLAPLLRDRQRLEQLKPRLLVFQFGGAAGTLAALGEDGPAVRSALAGELGLGLTPIPWHTQRDSLAELAAWLSLVSGSLAKMAQDIILMAQSEVGEIRESPDIARGGSSTMPQKSNPIASELIIAASRTNASLLSAVHQALIQEHERGTHGWQMEWITLPQMVGLTAGALNKAQFLCENLVVDAERMRQNVAASNGLMMAEALTFALAPAYMSRAAASQLVAEACRTASQEGRHLVEVVKERVDLPLDWASLADESAYFGASDVFIDGVLEQVV